MSVYGVVLTELWHTGLLINLPQTHAEKNRGTLRHRPTARVRMEQLCLEISVQFSSVQSLSLN